MTANEIEAGLTNEDENIRDEFAKMTDYTPTAEQIERGLLDHYQHVLEGNYDHMKEYEAEEFTVNEFSGAVNIRRSFAERENIVLTEKQISRGLNDDDPTVRLAFANREDISFTEAQVDSGLTDHVYVRLAFAQKDIIFTGSQIDLGLNDSDEGVREYFQEIQKKKLNTKFKDLTQNDPAAKPKNSGVITL